jgi:hypothetical protein
MRRGVVGTLLCAAAAIAGCADGPSNQQPQPAPVESAAVPRTSQPADTAHAPQTAATPQAAQGAASYLEHLVADPRLDPIRDKVPLVLRAGAVTPALLSNEDKPTPAEQRAIKVWVSAREQAQQYQLQQRGPPSPLLVRTRQLVTRAIVDLYNGDLTYGQFARRIQTLDSDYQAAARQPHQ